MKIEILEMKDDLIKFKMVNARHTVPQYLKTKLLENKDVLMASYLLEHPEDNDAIFLLKVKKGKDKKKILLETIKNLKEEVKDFKKKVGNALSKEK